jgi:alkylation response protein AidB-like acyl-CoA dehydrogenase
MEETALEHLDFLSENYVTDADAFPAAALEQLRASPLMVINVPKAYGGMGVGHSTAYGAVLAVLRRIGAYSLSMGRIYEGHVNALLLLNQFGTPEQKATYFAQAKNGRLFGVWNSELPQEKLRLVEAGEQFVLEGAKIFCSGASFIQRPIVTADSSQGARMLVLHLDEQELIEDYQYWQPLGMKASVSCRFDFSGMPVDPAQLLGQPYDYFAAPDFSGGAVRFAAVQLGGADAAIRATIQHLLQWNRTEDTLQRSRMGRLAQLKTSGDLWMKRAGRAFDQRYQQPEECMYIANLFRTVVRELCEEVLAICEWSVGLQGLLHPHPLERIHRDLSVYLKQPAPDKTLLDIGEKFIQTYATN